MRILNGAQTTLASLGVLAGHEYTFDAVADPLLFDFTHRMLTQESVPTLSSVPGIVPLAYVDQSLDRLRNTAIRHRCHQIATDGSQKIVQRLLNPAAERLRRGESVTYLPVAVAACIAYLVRASNRFGRAWTADDPQAGRIAAIADRIGRDPQGADRRDPRDRRHLPARPRRRHRLPRPPSPTALDGLSQRPSDGLSSGSARHAASNGRRRHEARNPYRAVSGHAARRGRRLGERRRLRGTGDRLLAEVLRADPALRRHQPHRCRGPHRGPGRRDRRRARRAGTSRSPASATIPTRCIPIPPTAPTVIAHLMHVITAAKLMGVPAGQHLLRRRRREAGRRQLAGRARRSGPISSPTPATMASSSPSRTAR